MLVAWPKQVPASHPVRGNAIVTGVAADRVLLGLGSRPGPAGQPQLWRADAASIRLSSRLSASRSETSRLRASSGSRFRRTAASRSWLHRSAQMRRSARYSCAGNQRVLVTRVERYGCRVHQTTGCAECPQHSRLRSVVNEATELPLLPRARDHGKLSSAALHCDRFEQRSKITGEQHRALESLGVSCREPSEAVLSLAY